MPDSTGAEQDGATVDKARFDGLMAAHQKVLAENRDLRAQGGSQAQTSQGDSQPELEDGDRYVVEDGQLVPDESPTPLRHNESRTAGRQPGQDDGSNDWAQQQLRKTLGLGEPPSWP